MTYQRNPDFIFTVMFDDELIKDYPPYDFEPIGNESLVSIVNDYENGKWRYRKFLNFVINNLKETALNEEERKAFIGKEGDVLSCAADRLRIEDNRDANSRGSEIAEILLYGLMRKYYGAIPAVPKIWHKQNRRLTVKGADSVHVVVHDDNRFELWLGEAKFYKDVRNAMAQTVKSVKETISCDAIRKENSFVTGLDDVKIYLHDKYPDRADELWQSILKDLGKNTSVDKIKTVLHVPILLLYECQITKGEMCFSEAYKKSIKDSHLENAKSYFKKQVEALKDFDPLYGAIHFHLILFPVPEKDRVVDGFYSRIEAYRGEENG